MQYVVDNGDVWYDHQQLAAFPFCSPPPQPGLAELADCCSSDLILSLISSCEEEEEETARSAAYLLPPPPVFPAADDVPPLPPTAGVIDDDDVLLLELEPFLEALGNELVVNGAPPIVPVALDHPIEKTTTTQPLQINGRHDDDALSVVVFTGYDETAAAEKQQRCAFARPPAVEKKKKRGDGPAAGGRSLQHVGLEELRKYFLMPMREAAQELEVGTTALKKRCRQLGVARWPHRKMKSLRSLISNLQEMGAGMMKGAGNGNGTSSSPALGAVQVAELELCRAMMEENPAMELTESAKKLRQACFKENYKRRRLDDAAATTTVNNMLEYGQCCSYYPPFSFSHHQLPQHLE